MLQIEVIMSYMIPGITLQGKKSQVKTLYAKINNIISMFYTPFFKSYTN